MQIVGVLEPKEGECKNIDTSLAISNSMQYSEMANKRYLMVLAHSREPYGVTQGFLSSKILSEYLLPELLASKKDIDYLPSISAGIRATRERLRDYVVRNPLFSGMDADFMCTIVSDRAFYTVGTSADIVLKAGSDGFDVFSPSPAAEFSILVKRDLLREDKLILCSSEVYSWMESNDLTEIFLKEKNLNKACGQIINMWKKESPTLKLSLMAAGEN